MGLAAALVNKKAASKAADVQAAASDRAANLQADAAREATAEQRRQFDLSREDLAPWRATGVNALGILDRASAGDMSGFFASPDYNFRRDEGMRDIGNSFAARGGAFSGNALKALSELNSNLAGSEFGNWWNRQAGRAGIGQAATNLGAQLGAGTANSIAGINTAAAGNIGNALMSGANARASGIIGGANAIGNGMSNAANMFGFFAGGGFGKGRNANAPRNYFGQGSIYG